MKLLLWNTKGLGSKVKSPINKEEITFTCCQGPAPLKDWCSHIKSAPWKVLLKLYECQLYRYFFSLLCFTFRACSMVLSKYWHWDFVLFVGLVIFKKLCICHFFFFLASFFSFLFFSFPPSTSLYGATGFVHFLLSEPSFKMQGFLLTGTEARKWEMTYTV